MSKVKLRIGYGYWYGDKSPMFRNNFCTRNHIVEIQKHKGGNETVTALCGTKSEQEGYYKHRHYFDNMHFYDLVKKSGIRLDEAILTCPGCLHWRKWAVLRDMVEIIEEER